MKKIILLLLFFSLFTQAKQPEQLAPEQLDRIIATVNDEPVTQSEFDRAMQMAKQELTALHIPMPNEAEFKKQVTKKLVDETLILQIAKNNNIEISDDELNNAISNIASRNNMNGLQFREALANEGLDFDDYRETLRRQILLQNIQSSVASHETFVSEKDIKKYLDNMAVLPQDKEYHLANILIKAPSSPSQEEIEKISRKAAEIIAKIKNNENFAQLAASSSDAPNALNGGDLGWTPLSDLPPELAEKIATLNIGDFIGPISTQNGVIILKILGTKTKQVDTSRATEYHVKHILLKKTNQVTDAALEKKLTQLREDILKSHNFATLAQVNSEDIASKNKGGDIGWITNKDVVPEFANMVQNTKTGNISKPFKSQYGWHILVVENKRTIDQSQKLRREQATAVLKQQKSKDAIQKWLNELEDSAYIQYFTT